MAGLLPTIALPKTSIEIGEQISVGANDVPVGAVAWLRFEGPIQPRGRCGASGTARAPAVPRDPSPSTGPGYYDSAWIEGCAPGGDAVIRLESQNGSVLYDRRELRVTTAKPAQVLAPTIIPSNGILTVRWYAPNDRGSAITAYKVAWPGNEGSVGGDARSYVITGLTNGTAYPVKVRACNAIGCGEWSDEVEGTPAVTPPGEVVGPPPGPVTVFVPCGTEDTGGLAKPGGLTIAPVPQRQAVLMWNGTTGADRYVVEVQRHGSASWIYPVQGNESSAEVRDPCYTINLDTIMTPTGGAAEGLADYDAYQFRVTARDATNAGIVSDIVAIVDTPITRANGDSRGGHSAIGPGLATITWTPIHQKVSTIPSGGEYQLRHRLVVGDHTLPGWEPSSVSSFAAPARQMRPVRRES